MCEAVYVGSNITAENRDTFAHRTKMALGSLQYFNLALNHTISFADGWYSHHYSIKSHLCTYKYFLNNVLVLVHHDWLDINPKNSFITLINGMVHRIFFDLRNSAFA